MGPSKYSKYKGCEVLFGANRRFQAESIAQSLLEHVEQSSAILCSTCCLCIVLVFSVDVKAQAVPQLTSGGRLCTTRTLGLHGPGALMTSGGAGLVTA